MDFSGMDIEGDVFKYRYTAECDADSLGADGDDLLPDFRSASQCRGSDTLSLSRNSSLIRTP